MRAPCAQNIVEAFAALRQLFELAVQNDAPAKTAIANVARIAVRDQSAIRPHRKARSDTRAPMLPCARSPSDLTPSGPQPGNSACGPASRWQAPRKSSLGHVKPSRGAPAMQQGAERGKQRFCKRQPSRALRDRAHHRLGHISVFQCAARRLVTGAKCELPRKGAVWARKDAPEEWV